VSEEKTLFDQLEAIRSDVIQQVRHNGPALAAADKLIVAIQPVREATEAYRSWLHQLLETIDNLTSKAAVAYEYRGPVKDGVRYEQQRLEEAAAAFAAALSDLNDAVTAYAFSPARHHTPAVTEQEEAA